MVAGAMGWVKGTLQTASGSQKELKPVGCRWRPGPLGTLCPACVEGRVGSSRLSGLLKRRPYRCLVRRSGAEDRHGYIWDRHYNICLAKLQHDNVVNSVAFSPVEQELLLTASDDSTIKVWRSPRVVRIQQARKLRPRKLLFSWLMNQKS